MDNKLIHELHHSGLTNAAIAAQVGCHRNTVRYILRGRLPDQAEVVADRMRPQDRPGPASKTEVIRERLVAALQEQKDGEQIPGGALLTRARTDWGYGGQRSAFYDLLRQVRPPPTPPLMTRFEGLPGEFTQFDFGQALVPLGRGKVRVRFFAGRLKYSRFMHALRVPDEKAESLVRGVVDCLNAWKGSTGQWVFDNPETVWTTLGDGHRILHQHLRQLVSEMNVCVEPCTPRMANQKGTIESLVKFIKANFLPGRSFADLDDFDRQLAQWLHYVNHERRCDATSQVPNARLAEEVERLGRRPVPWSSADYPLREEGTVGPTGLVTYRGTPYSVNPRRLGAPATVLVRRTTIELVVGDERIIHDRDDGVPTPHRKPEHSLAEVAMITEGRKRTYIKREYLLHLGPASWTFIDQLVSRHRGNTWYPSIHRLYDLAVKVPATVFLAACERCHRERRYAVIDVQTALRGEVN
jgi:transposase